MDGSLYLLRPDTCTVGSPHSVCVSPVLWAEVGAYFTPSVIVLRDYSTMHIQQDGLI